MLFKKIYHNLNKISLDLTFFLFSILYLIIFFIIFKHNYPFLKKLNLILIPFVLLMAILLILIIFRFKNKIKILPSKLKEGSAAIVGASALVWKELEKMG